MEDRVHLPCGWESEFVGGRGYDLFNFKWFLMFGHEFPRGVMKI